jgi:hypothetical protein
MENKNETSKFFNLTVIHPHSGRVNRSVISRIIKHLSNGYLNSDKENANYLAKYSEGTQLIVEDVNYQIIGRMST